MENYLLGLQQFLLEPMTIVALFGGVILGMVVGALPGLNDSITIAVLIPITFGMNPKIALALLVGVYVASACGGSIPAVLLEIPGTASAVVTAYDGYPMQLKGRGLEALSICMTSSTFGGIFSSLMLIFFAPMLASFALKFGPPEYFALCLMGIATVIGMAGKDCWKHFISMAFGLWLSCMGISTATGMSRFTFGSMSLMDGLPLVPRMIGLFGILSVMKLMEAVKVNKAQESVDKVTTNNFSNPDDKVAFLRPKMIKRLLPTWLRGSVIGSVLGCMPGAGMTMAIFTAYDLEKKCKPDLEFGTGVEEGIAAPEAANNGVVASSMIPLLSLGIPGNSTSALFIGALTIHGVVAGPSLFSKQPDLAYLIIMAFLIGNLMMLPLALAFCKYLAAKVLKLDARILAAVIIGLCLTGSFAYKNNPFHIYVAVAFGVVGWLFNKFDIPTSPFILASILGDMMENNFLSSLVYTGSVDVFFMRPISLVLMIVSIIFILWPWLSSFISKIKNKAKAAS